MGMEAPSCMVHFPVCLWRGGYRNPTNPGKMDPAHVVHLLRDHARAVPREDAAQCNERHRRSVFGNQPICPQRPVPGAAVRRYLEHHQACRPAEPPLGIALRLARLLAMMGAAHDGEALNASRLADRLVRESGATWLDVLTLRALTAASGLPRRQDLLRGGGLDLRAVAIIVDTKRSVMRVVG